MLDLFLRLLISFIGSNSVPLRSKFCFYVFICLIYDGIMSENASSGHGPARKSVVQLILSLSVKIKVLL